MKEFEVVIAHMIDRKYPIAEIWYENFQWVEISQETGNCLIQFYPHPDQDYWEFRCEEAISILEEAKNKLIYTSSSKDNLFTRKPIEPEEVNNIGQNILEAILNDPNKITYQLPDGSIKVYDQNGRGAFFKKNGDFRGFIERYE